ncbi:MAG: hypothetical protein Q7S03_00895 [bacterium]|nr:hypothetical protein [bacterium]
MKRTVFIIPGYRHQATDKAYKEIARRLKKEGYSPILVNIPWKQTTISENTRYFLKKYRNKKTRNSYLLGFSFGAIIAFLASTKVSVSGLILCSLSPFFKEDLPKFSDNVFSPLKAERYQDFSRLHCATLAKKIKAKQIHLLYGTKEASSLKKRVADTYDKIPTAHKYLISIKEVEHNIGDIRYINKIHQIAKEIN